MKKISQKSTRHFLLCVIFIIGAVITGYGVQLMYCPLIFGGMATIISVISAIEFEEKQS